MTGLQSFPTLWPWQPWQVQTISLLGPVQRRGTRPGKDRQLDFTHLLQSLGLQDTDPNSHLYGLAYEALPTHLEKAMEVEKQLLKLLPSLNYPSPPFISEIIQKVAKVLGMKYYLHSAWRHQSSGKIKRANQTLKQILVKPWQKTTKYYLWLLPGALERLWNNPQTDLNKSSLAMSHGRPFLSSDMEVDPETTKL